MANGSDSGEYVVLSKVRPGLKREFVWALKSQTENGSIGRTRSGKPHKSPFRDVLKSNKRPKRSAADEIDNEPEESAMAVKAESDLEARKRDEVIEKVMLMSEGEEPKSDVVDIDLPSDDERKSKMVESTIREEEPKDDVAVDSEPVTQALNRDKDQNLKCEHLENVNSGTIEETLPETTPRIFTRLALKADMTDEVTESEAISSADSTTSSKIEMKMSKKIPLKRFPSKVKELLDTALLEGLPVRYLRGTKVRGPKETGLRGVIKGSGILCYCNMCGGAEVVTPNQFELHAGSSNKRPPEYIYLENGNTLREVLNACKVSSFEILEATIKQAIGSSPEKSQPTFCINCKGSIPTACNGKGMLLCETCLVSKEPLSAQGQPIPPTDKIDRPSLSVSVHQRSSDRLSGSAPRRKGKLTRKDLRMHKLVFECDVLADGTALAYYARGQKLLEGYKKGAGIFCFCCNTEVSPSQFEAHAGWASRRKPYLHIYTSNGVSLHELSIGLAKQRKFSADENDDLCTICADGGDLLLCDNCPRAFHPECASLPNVPQGTWYCKYCQNMFQKEKFVERNVNAVAAGRVTGIDPIEEITKRCIRIVQTSEAADVGGCVLCRGHDFSKSGFDSGTVILCDQCEKEFHVGCLKEHNMDDLKELPKGKWFCCADCSRIHGTLQKLVADGGEKLPEALIYAIKKKHEEKVTSENTIDLDVRWRLLCGKMASDETRVLLSKAVSIFHDQFDPIADSSTSRLDLIPHMVYGRNLRDQEYGGMYCAILTVNSTVVSAGIFRIFGKEVAELPLVATSSDCQGQGYFGSLFSCIENLLISLNVKDLVLPAADEAESLWTNKFGFEKITPDQLKEHRKHHQMMIFHGTNMLHKPVLTPLPPPLN